MLRSLIMPLECLFNGLLKKIKALHFFPFMRGINWWPVDSTHKEPEMQKGFSCNVVIIEQDKTCVWCYLSQGPILVSDLYLWWDIRELDHVNEVSTWSAAECTNIMCDSHTTSRWPNATFIQNFHLDDPYNDFTWTLRHLISLATGMFVQNLFRLTKKKSMICITLWE